MTIATLIFDVCEARDEDTYVRPKHMHVCLV